MIDISTGSIDIGEITLSPTLTVDQFKNSGLYNGASLERIYTLKGTKNISNKNFIVSIYFLNSYLKEIHLYDTEDNSEDWSESNELDKKKRQDEWLKSLLGKGAYKYPWGVIESLFDPKGGFSSIIIRYK